MKRKSNHLESNKETIPMKKMESLPQELIINIISFVPLVDIIKLRLTNKWWKWFIENNLKYFYSDMRRRNPKIPKILFFQNFIINVKKYRIGLEKVERNRELEILTKMNQEEKEQYLIDNDIKLGLAPKLSVCDNELIERYLYLRRKGENHYSCQLHAFSNWDDMDFLVYLYLKRLGETSYSAEKITEFQDDNKIRKYLFLKKRGESSYQAEHLVKNFNDKQISTYLYVRSEGVYPYSSQLVVEKFNNDQIVRFIYLINCGFSPYYSESIVSKLDDETIERFLICLKSGLDENDSKCVIEKLTREETRKFLSLKSEGVNELNKILVSYFDI